MTRRQLFIVCAPGLEAIVADEVRGLIPGADPRLREGGVEVRASDPELARLSVGLRAATRILARLTTFRAASFAELHSRAARIPWEAYLRPGQAVSIRASAQRSRLYHTAGIAERIAVGIGERLGVAPPLAREAALEADGDGDDAGALEAAEREDAALVLARIVRDQCTISVDASGEPLHRRGYRKAIANAPLRESLAAGVLLASVDPGDAIVDPMCGSGTLAIEAALLASATPPGLTRGFACEGWPSLPADHLATLRAELGARTPSRPPAPIVGSDRDPGAAAAAAANAARAGVSEWLTIREADLHATEPPAGRGLVVTNPPYGVRIGERGRLPAIYAALGEHLRRAFAGPGLAWRLALLAADPRLAAATGLDLEPRLNLRNGGIPVTLYVGPIARR